MDPRELFPGIPLPLHLLHDHGDLFTAADHAAVGEAAGEDAFEAEAVVRVPPGDDDEVAAVGVGDRLHRLREGHAEHLAGARETLAVGELLPVVDHRHVKVEQGADLRQRLRDVPAAADDELTPRAQPLGEQAHAEDLGGERPVAARQGGRQLLPQPAQPLVIGDEAVRRHERLLGGERASLPFPREDGQQVGAAARVEDVGERAEKYPVHRTPPLRCRTASSAPPAMARALSEMV